jgi:hypothetical protein
MVKFPLYELRAYNSIIDEGFFRVIQTQKTRYVLDFLNSDLSSYAERRVALLRHSLPYKLYPLSRRIENFSNLITSKSRNFIDAEGNLVSWKPKKFREVLCLPIETRFTNNSGNVVVRPKGISESFTISKKVGARYAQVVKVGKRYYLFDMQYERVPTTRKKI